MFPHERSLVERLKDAPFALVGVNSDSDLAQMKPKFKEEKITWRSFWNGPDGTGGPIAQDWNVSGWPTLYVLDHEGKIRHKHVGSPGDEVLDKEIDDLVAEAKAAKGTKPAGDPEPKKP
jgi:hypothetical protein